MTTRYWKLPFESRTPVDRVEIGGIVIRKQKGRSRWMAMWPNETRFYARLEVAVRSTREMLIKQAKL